MSTAVATRAQAMQLFEQFTDEKQYNILRPSETVMTATSPFHTVYANVITFDIATDAYKTDKTYALNRRALDRIASAAGISFIDRKVEFHPTDPDIVTVTVLAEMRRPDGSPIRTTGTKTVDAKKRSGSVDQNRKFKTELAETGAKNRAIKSLMSLKSSYPEHELRKPFVVPQITVNYDEIVKDPVLRQIAGAQALGAAGMLYPQQNPSLSTTQPQNAGALPASPFSEQRALPAAVVPEPEPRDDPNALPDLPFDEPPTDDNAATIRRLFAERNHGKSDAVLEKMLAATPEQQVGYIDWLSGFAIKAPQAAPAAQSGRKGALSEKQIKRLFAIAYGNGYDNDSLHELIARLFNGITSIDDLAKEQYNFLCGDDKTETPSYLEAHPFVGGAR